MALHFSFEGRMDLSNLADEARRIVSLLDRNGVTGAHGVRIRLVPLHEDRELIFTDRARQWDLEVVDVPPLRQIVTSGPSPVDPFAEQTFECRSGMPMSLTRHKEMMRLITGPNRGPANASRLRS